MKYKGLFRNKTFLIVEDCQPCVLLYEEWLLETEAKLIFAKNGNEAIMICQKEKNIDLVLMDIVLPGINGLEATKKIKLFKNKLPIIAVSASVCCDIKQNCKEAGCDLFIEKPICEMVLLDSLYKILFLNKNIIEIM